MSVWHAVRALLLAVLYLSGICPATRSEPNAVRTLIVRSDLGADGVFRLRGGALAVLGERGAVALVNAVEPAEVPGEVLDSVEAMERRVAALMPQVDRGKCIVRALVLPVSKRRLGVAVVYDGGPVGLLRSHTTRTPGLIAAIDLLPEARPLGRSPDRENWSRIRALEDRIQRVEAATGPVLGTYGVVAGLLLFGAVGVAVGAPRRRSLRRAARAGVRLVGAGPLLLLFAPAWTTTPASVTVAVGAAALLAGFPLRIGLALLVVVVAGDALTGGALVAFSPLSGYHLAGVRFYGIGNEYMGFGLAAILVAIPMSGLASGLAFSAAFLGAPMLGANAGGAMAAAAAAVAAWLESRGRLRKANLALPFMAALVAALLVALWDRAMPDAARSHIGRAVAEGQQRGAGALAGIAWRKLLMNLRIATTPGALAALPGIGGLVWFYLRSRLAVSFRRSVASDAELAARLRIAAVAAVAAALFNDSGLVAAALLLAPLIGTVVERSLTEDPDP